MNEYSDLQKAMSVQRIKGWLERNPQGGSEPIHPDDLRVLLSAQADSIQITESDANWLAPLLDEQKWSGHCGEGNVERRERSIWNGRIDRILSALEPITAKKV